MSGSSTKRYPVELRDHTQYRACMDTRPGLPVTEEVMLAAEAATLQEARAQGLGRWMTDAQLLMLLQHHGHHTRLIDVSERLQGARYFAVVWTHAGQCWVIVRCQARSQPTVSTLVLVDRRNRDRARKRRLDVPDVVSLGRRRIQISRAFVIDPSGGPGIDVAGRRDPRSHPFTVRISARRRTGVSVPGPKAHSLA